MRNNMRLRDTNAKVYKCVQLYIPMQFVVK